MRVVLDTNVLLVSISDRSPHHWLFRALLEQRFSICVSNEILNEYAEIIERHMGEVASESVLGVLENLPNVVPISTYFRFGLLSKDPDDNKFVDCAVASNADFIVTEDRDFDALEAIEFPQVNILSLKEFFEELH